jgi:hypothetical protein
MRTAISLDDLSAITPLMPQPAPGEPAYLDWDGDKVTVAPAAQARFSALFANGSLTAAAQAEIAGRGAQALYEHCRAECARRILARASEATQRNMALYAGVLALVPAADRTNPQKADVVALGDAAAWVAEMRARWPVIAAEGLDPADDAQWPEPSAEALALAARF